MSNKTFKKIQFIKAELDSLDFENNTATFKVPNEKSTAGKYYITKSNVGEVMRSLIEALNNMDLSPQVGEAWSDHVHRLRQYREKVITETNELAGGNNE